MINKYKLIFLKLKKYIVVTIVLLLISGCFFNKKYKLSPEEAVAWTGLRLAIAESVLYDGSTTLTTYHIDLLKNAARNFDKKCEWFSENDDKYIAYGKMLDTEKYQITKLCSEDYCAVFKVEEEDGSYYIVGYSFEKSTGDGHILFPKEKSSL